MSNVAATTSRVQAGTRLLSLEHVRQVPAHRGVHLAGAAAPPQPRDVQVLRGRTGEAAGSAREVRDHADADARRRRGQARQRAARGTERLQGHRAVPRALAAVIVRVTAALRRPSRLLRAG